MNRRSLHVCIFDRDASASIVVQREASEHLAYTARAVEYLVQLDERGMAKHMLSYSLRSGRDEEKDHVLKNWREAIEADFRAFVAKLMPANRGCAADLELEYRIQRFAHAEGFFPHGGQHFFINLAAVPACVKFSSKSHLVALSRFAQRRPYRLWGNLHHIRGAWRAFNG